MTAKEVEKIKVAKERFNKMLDILSLEDIETINQALEELEVIKSADGGRVMRSYYMLEQQTNGKHLIVETLNGEDDKTQIHLDILKNYLLKAQAQEQELRELKEKVSNFKNYTSLIDFLNVMKIYEWNDEAHIILEVGFDDGEEAKELTIQELRANYADYSVFDYDFYHEVTDDNYVLRGWIEIGRFDDLCKGSEE